MAAGGIVFSDLLLNIGSPGNRGKVFVAGLTLVQNAVCSYEKMKNDWSQLIVAYFCKQENKDLRNLKGLYSFISGWNKLKSGICKVWYIVASSGLQILCNCFHSEFVGVFLWTEKIAADNWYGCTFFFLNISFKILWYGFILTNTVITPSVPKCGAL